MNVETLISGELPGRTNIRPQGRTTLISPPAAKTFELARYGSEVRNSLRVLNNVSGASANRARPERIIPVRYVTALNGERAQKTSHDRATEFKVKLNET